MAATLKNIQPTRRLDVRGSFIGHLEAISTWKTVSVRFHEFFRQVGWKTVKQCNVLCKGSGTLKQCSRLSRISIHKTLNVAYVQSTDW